MALFYSKCNRFLTRKKLSFTNCISVSYAISANYRLRGNGARWPDIRHFGPFIGQLRLRSDDPAERVYQAMQCRLYTPQDVTKDRPRFECSALQDELGCDKRSPTIRMQCSPRWATRQIVHFPIKKVTKNGFLRGSILRKKSGKTDCWIGREPKLWDVTAYGCEQAPEAFSIISGRF